MYYVPRRLDRGPSENLLCLEVSDGSGEGRVRAVLEALEGKRTIKETTSVLAGCGKTMSARETGGPSETGQTRWDPICPRRTFLALRGSRSMDAGGLFQHPATLNPAFCVLTMGYT